MRIRSVKPEWLDDELLAAASDEARVLSIALLLMSDDYGRGRASLATIAAGAWRFQMERDDGAHAPEVLARASRALRELVEMRFVVLYEVDRQRYFAIRNWAKHQKVDRPSAPRIPAPPDAGNPENPDPREPPSEPSRVSRETVASPSMDPRDRSGSGSGSPIRTTTTSAVASVCDDDTGTGRYAQLALDEALRADGGAYVMRDGDAGHFRTVAESAQACRGKTGLRDLLNAWARDFVVEFRVRNARNFATYAQARAANGGKRIASAPTYRGKPEDTTPVAGSKPDAAHAEAKARAAKVARDRAEAVAPPVDLARLLKGGIGRAMP